MHCEPKTLPPPLGRRGCCHTLSLPCRTSTACSPPLPLQTGTCHQLKREKNSAKHNTALSWLSLQNSGGICCLIRRDQRAQRSPEPAAGWREWQEGLAAARPALSANIQRALWLRCCRLASPCSGAGTASGAAAGTQRGEGSPGSCSERGAPGQGSRSRGDPLRAAQHTPTRTGKDQGRGKLCGGGSRTRMASQRC